MSEWQPIETAPKDGRWLLVAPVYNKQRATCLIAAWRPEAGDENYPWVDYGYHDSWRIDTFTHWQPLPSPPNPQEQGSER